MNAVDWAHMAGGYRLHIISCYLTERIHLIHVDDDDQNPKQSFGIQYFTENMREYEVYCIYPWKVTISVCGVGH